MAASLPSGTTFPRGLPTADLIQWPLVAARDFLELRYGRALVEADRRPGDIPVYGTNGRCGSHDQALFAGPGVILGRKGQGPLGVEWCDGSYWVIDTAYAVAPIRSDVDLRYAYFLIKFIGLNHLKDGTSNPTLSRDSFGAQALPMPPLTAQRAIAHILRTLDDKIELNRRMTETLEAIAQALFKSWFVDFDPVRAKAEGHDPCLNPLTDLFPGSFEDSERGKIPQGWRYRPLGDSIELTRGRTYKSSLKGLPGPVLLGLSSIARNGGFRQDKLSTYGGDSPASLLLSPGDLFASLKDVTQTADLLGAVARVPPHVEAGRLTQDTVKLRFRTGGTSQQIVYRTLLTSEYRDYCRAHATGTTNLGLSRSDFLAFPVVQVSKQVEHAFDSAIEKIEARISSAIAESRTLATLRDTLLPKLISGELRMKGTVQGVTVE